MIRVARVLALTAVAATATEIGYYQWNSPLPEEPGDLLTAAREQAARSGAEVFRFYVGPRFDYQRPYLDPERHAAEPAPMLDLPHYRAALEDDRFSTIVLTVYSALDYGAGADDLNLLRPFGDRERAAVGAQIGAAARLLLERYGDQDRTIVLANNEADEKLMEIATYTRSPELAVRNLIGWANARQAAVEAARAAYPDSKLRLLNAFEISVVNLKIAPFRGRYRKTALPVEGIRAIDDVLPAVKCDLVSYSAYESTNSPYRTRNPNAPAAETGERLRRDLDRIRAAADGSISTYGRGLLGRNFVMIGELGFARETFEALPNGGVLPRLHSAIEAAEDWGAPWVILWQVFDAPKWGSRAWGFGAVDASGNRPLLSPALDGCSSIAACVESWTND